jgi:hypothetical protein
VHGRKTRRPSDYAHPLLEVLERLLEFLAGVHDERAVVRHRLADRLAAQDHDLQVRGVPVLLLVRADGQRGTRAEDRGLPMWIGRRSAPTAAPGHHVREGVEVLAPRQRDLRAGRHVAWIMVIGVCVMPGPWWPSSSPAMTRSSAPPSGVVSSWTWPPRMSW